jgi:DUF1365 family protein
MRNCDAPAVAARTQVHLSRLFRVFDLDEIDALDRSLRLFSRNRFNLFSFHDRDYAGEGAIMRNGFWRILLRSASC